MNHSIVNEKLIITANGFPHDINYTSASISFPNKRYSRKSDNSKGRNIWSERPDWRDFELTVNVPKDSCTNDFLTQAAGYSVSFTWKSAKGTKLIHSNVAKVNFDTASSEIESTDNVWIILGRADKFNIGGSGDLLAGLNLPGLVPEII